MEPVYRQGSLCWVDTIVDLESLEIGDAVVDRSLANSLVLHRLVNLQMQENLSSFLATMKGDGNELMQTVELSHTNYIGREAFTLPNLGSVIEHTMTYHLIWIAAGIFLLLSCVPWVTVKRCRIQ